MTTKTFGIMLGTTGPNGIPNGHSGSGSDVQVVYDTSKVTTRKQLAWALTEIQKMIEGSQHLTP